MLDVKNVNVRYENDLVVNDVSFHLQTGDWLMLVGANGAGKSSLLSAIAQSTAYTGEIRLGGIDARSYRAKEFAKRVGVLSQVNHVEYDYSAREVIRLGRYAHSSGVFSSLDVDGDRAVADAIRATGLEQLEDKSVLTLSGGELQRVFLAQVFAQEPELLLLDEPANHLDLLYQKQLFSSLSAWLAHGGRSIIAVVHDLSLAMKYGTHVLLLHDGKNAAYGYPKDALQRDYLQMAYGMDVKKWMTELLDGWQ